MPNKMVSVQYKDKQSNTYSGRTYTYFCTLPVRVGDEVLVPTSRGERMACIVEVDLDERTIKADTLPKLKTITAFQPNETSEAEGTTLLEGLIVVKQLPIIEERLRTIRDEMERRTQEALALVCTEETVKEIKAVRSQITKTFHQLETARKQVKQEVLAPYEAFEQQYKTYITNVYAPADAKLKTRITEVEDGLKEQKRATVSAYFDEYAQAKGIDFLTFETSGISVRLSDSFKRLREMATDVINTVVEDLALIETQPHKDEILVEYKRTRNVAVAITTVTQRHAAIEAEQRRQAERATVVQTEQVCAQRVDAFRPPVEAAPPAEPASEEVLACSFTVYATVTQLRNLKEFMKQEDIRYE